MAMERLSGRDYILIISHDVVGSQMAGPGIRYYHLARVLARHFEVVLAIPHGVSFEMEVQDFIPVHYLRKDWNSIKHLVKEAKIIIFPSDIASDFPQLMSCEAFLVIDGYDPLLAEWLELNKLLSLREQQSHWWYRVRDLNYQYLTGDFFICASERQRDWWLGLLEANGRINSYTFREDPSLRSLIDVVPFGLPREPPKHTRQILKGVWPGINENDKIILWGGGLWPWLDPLTAIRAICKIQEERKDVKLVFPGTQHPNPWMANIPTHTENARRLAQDLGLLNQAVFFGKWVPYADWPNVLLESDVALTLHYDTLETRLAFRSRVLDYIWAGLPIVATYGDVISALVAEYGIGITVDYKDVNGVAAAILQLLETPREDFEGRFEKARQELTWERAAQPLVEFCRHPRRAPDRVAMGKGLGNPYYFEERRQLLEERDYWRDLVRRYEQGRFIRFMRWVHRIRRAFRKG
jgi:glycosyltransferase involved in cell wall biosynthesis